MWINWSVLSYGFCFAVHFVLLCWILIWHLSFQFIYNCQLAILGIVFCAQQFNFVHGINKLPHIKKSASQLTKGTCLFDRFIPWIHINYVEMTKWKPKRFVQFFTVKIQLSKRPTKRLFWIGRNINTATIIQFEFSMEKRRKRFRLICFGTAI